MKKYFLLLSLIACSQAKNFEEINRKDNLKKEDDFLIVDTIDTNDKDSTYKIFEDIKNLVDKIAETKINKILSLIEENKNKFKKMEEEFLKELKGITPPQRALNLILGDVVNSIKVTDIKEVFGNIEKHLTNVQNNIIIPKYANKESEQENENITLGIKQVIQFILELFREKIDMFHTLLSIKEIISAEIGQDTANSIRNKLYYFYTDQEDTEDTIKNYILSTKESVEDICKDNLSIFLDAKLKINKYGGLELNNLGNILSGKSIVYNGLSLTIKDNKILLAGVQVRLKKYSLK